MYFNVFLKWFVEFKDYCRVLKGINFVIDGCVDYVLWCLYDKNYGRNDVYG